jgi:hypothetical protein
MLTYKELQEKGICWTGYKRKKGTKPYEDGSCMKEEQLDELKHGTISSYMQKARTQLSNIEVSRRSTGDEKIGAEKARRRANTLNKIADKTDSRAVRDQLHKATSFVKEELEKHHTLAFGRMNPITSGHEAVVNKLHSVAKEHNATHSLVVSHSQDAKKNPLSAEQKVKHAKHAFPGTKVTAASKEAPTILHHAAAAHAAGATHLHVVAGSDRHEEMHNLLHKYNGQNAAHGHYNFKKITVHSSGERDPDAEGTTGISASKMREHAASGNKTAFHAGAPSKMKPEHKDAMYNDVRKGMNLKEQAPIAPVPDRKYIKGTPENKALKAKNKPINGHPTNVKEETQEQQDDRSMQLKRFKDQMSQSNGPQIDTEIALDKKEKDIMTGKIKQKNKTELGLSKKEQDNLSGVNETLRPEMGAAHYIDDFIKSTDPRFNNKSKAERRRMAIGAYMAAKAKGMKEETINEYSMADLHKDAADRVKKDIDKASNDRIAALKNPPKKKGFFAKVGEKQINMVKGAWHGLTKEEIEEGTLQGNVAGGDAMNTTTSAPSDKMPAGSVKKVKGFKFFNGTNEPNTQMTVKEELDRQLSMLEEAAKAIDQGEYDYEGQMARTQLQTILRNSKDLIAMLSDEDNLPEWVQSKITLAQDYITCVRDYLQSKEELGEETLDERNKANALMRKTMDASRGAKFKLKNPVPDADPKHKTARDHNVAIGRALRNEAATGNPGGGYHGACGTPDDMYDDMHKHVKNLTDGDDKTVKHYLDSGHGKKLAGREQDHDHIKADFKKFMKYYRPEMHDSKPDVKEETAPVGKPQKIALKTAVIKLHPNGVASDTEEGWAKPKKIKEGTMKSYKEFLQSLDEKLIGSQKKLDKNHNNKLDAQDFKLLRKEETEALDEIKLADLPSRKIQGRSYGADYHDPEGADDAWEKEGRRGRPAGKAGRKAGSGAGVYKPRKTMSKLKQLGATYK